MKKKFPFYTIALIVLLVAVYFISLMYSRFYSFLLYDFEFMKPWSFLTTSFLHMNILHLFYNLIGLAYFGILLEFKKGFKFFLIVFLSSLVFTGILGMFNYSVFLGVSGAVYGIIGYLMATMERRNWKIYLPILLWVLAGFVGEIIFSINVAHDVHLYGLVFGFLLSEILT
jgi:rhomboid protease GluP